jgi:hypothetical protein
MERTSYTAHFSNVTGNAVITMPLLIRGAILINVTLCFGVNVTVRLDRVSFDLSTWHLSMHFNYFSKLCRNLVW